MAFTQTHTIADIHNRLVIKRVNYANTETSNVLVNAASLNSALTTLNLTAGANTFKVGETITAASGGTATVQSVINATCINVVNLTGTFGNNNVVTGGTSTRTRVQDGAAVPATYNLTVSKLIFNIGGLPEAKLQIDWQGDGTSNHRTVAMLSGVGVLELDQLGVRVDNNAVNATGNLLISTINWNANCHYSLIVDIGKTSGYSFIQTDENQGRSF